MSAPSEFPRSFAAVFSTQDAEGMANLFAPEGSFHNLTSQFCEGRAAIAKGMAEEFAGTARTARLVTGKTAITPIGPGAAIVHQRYVVAGLRDVSGADLPRIGALLTAVLVAKGDGWLALSATFGLVEG